MTTLKTPAKLILSGEHAVVHGAPALGLPFPLHTKTTITPHQNTGLISFFIPPLQIQKSFDLEELRQLRVKTDQNYHAFLKGNLSIKEIMKSSNLMPYALASYIEQYGQIDSGLHIEMDSEIPIGVGLGSSASCITGLLQSLFQLFHSNMSQAEQIDLAHQIENIAHGKSSGFDINLVWHAKPLYYHQKKYTHLDLPAFPLQCVNTGKSDSTTAECVEQTSKLLQSAPDLIAHFAKTTEKLLESILHSDLSGTKKHITENHYLLCELGVVPDKVQACIEALQKKGNAAKMCGAGSISGEQAGVMAVVGKDSIFDILNWYGYSGGIL